MAMKTKLDVKGYGRKRDMEKNQEESRWRRISQERIKGTPRARNMLLCRETRHGQSDQGLGGRRASVTGIFQTINHSMKVRPPGFARRGTRCRV